MHTDKIKYLAFLFIPGLLTIISVLVNFSWLPEFAQRYLTPVCLSVAMVWAFHYPEKAHKRIHRWWIIGSLLVLIFWAFPEGFGRSETESLIRKIMGIVCAIIALVAYFFRAQHYPIEEDSDIRASLKTRRISTVIALVCLVALTISILLYKPTPFAIDEPNIAAIAWFVAGGSAMIISIITYYAEATKRALSPDRSIEDKIDQIGE